jgi:hypothetical protein
MQVAGAILLWVAGVATLLRVNYLFLRMVEQIDEHDGSLTPWSNFQGKALSILQRHRQLYPNSNLRSVVFRTAFAALLLMTAGLVLGLTGLYG